MKTVDNYQVKRSFVRRLPFYFASVVFTTSISIMAAVGFLVPAILFMVLFLALAYLNTDQDRRRYTQITKDYIIVNVPTIWGENKEEIHTGDIKEITVRHGRLSQTLFNYGTLIIGLEGKDVTVDYVHNPIKVADMVSKLISRHDS